MHRDQQISQQTWVHSGIIEIFQRINFIHFVILFNINSVLWLWLWLCVCQMLQALLEVMEPPPLTSELIDSNDNSSSNNGSNNNNNSNSNNNIDEVSPSLTGKKDDSPRKKLRTAMLKSARLPDLGTVLVQYNIIYPMPVPLSYYDIIVWHHSMTS